MRTSGHSREALHTSYSHSIAKEQRLESLLTGQVSIRRHSNLWMVPLVIICRRPSGVSRWFALGRSPFESNGRLTVTRMYSLMEEFPVNNWPSTQMQTTCTFFLLARWEKCKQKILCSKKKKIPEYKIVRSGFELGHCQRSRSECLKWY